MDIQKSVPFYTIIGELAFHLSKGNPKLLDFPYQILIVQRDINPLSSVLASCCEFEDAVEEADKLDADMRVEAHDPTARITVVKLSYSGGLVVWDDLLPLVPVG